MISTYIHVKLSFTFNVHSINHGILHDVCREVILILSMNTQVIVQNVQ